MISIYFLIFSIIMIIKIDYIPITFKNIVLPSMDNLQLISGQAVYHIVTFFKPCYIYLNGG
jgi:hypothetical protein